MNATDMMIERYRLARANFWVAVAAFGVGAVMAVMQALARADVDLYFKSEQLYYISVTAHGVLMALVFTTFFIMSLGFIFAQRCLGFLVTERWGWVSFWVATVGTVITTLAILSGSSTVLYTFYPPLQAHPLFYIGATLLIVGSWIWCGIMLLSARRWRKENPGKPLPLPVHGILAAVIIWLFATFGLAAEVLGQLIPWSLGWVKTIDPVVARTWFWWFGHPLTYFWLVPAYVVWYNVLPRIAGGRIFSEKLTRMVFILFIVFSTPVGFHHQMADPGVSSSWKLVHTFTTYAILFPSLVTAFSIIASLEVGGRLRGAKGLLDWIPKLPWRDPFFSSILLAMLTFALGGFGGAINAAYAMNTMVHNTAWIMGHFHLTVGTAVALTFMGASYWMLPRFTGRKLVFPQLAEIQPYLWFVGMMLFGVVNHITGIMGMPRRVYSGSYLGSEIAAQWQSLTNLSAIGGIILFVSSFCYLAVLISTVFFGKKVETPDFVFATPLGGHSTTTGLWDRIGLWTIAAVVLVIAAYGYPIYHLLTMERFGSLPFKPF